MAKSGSKAERWAVTVRLSDGSIRYYAEQSERQGQQEWTPRENQAHGFSSHEDAASFIALCERNSVAREYAVVAVTRR